MHSDDETTNGMASRRSFFKQVSLLPAAWPMAGYLESAYSHSPAPSGSLPSGGDQPAWMRQGTVAAWGMISLLFYTRRGDVPEGYAERWKDDFNEAMAEYYQKIGVNLVIVTMHAGAGLKAEADNIDVVRKFTAIAHRYGIKLIGYVGATMAYETFYDEEPEAPGWEMIDERGRPMYYGVQTWRHIACKNNPGYSAFIRKVLRMGLEDLKLDGFIFDQMEWWAEPSSCHCKYCQEGFRAYLRNKYNDEQLKARLGFANVNGIRVPDFNLNAPPVPGSELKDPLRQEWARFRCASLGRWWGGMHEYVRELNPEAILISNPTFYLETNAGFIHGVDLQQVLPHNEIVWTEEGNEPRWTPDERLVSRIRAYKAARAMGRSLMVWQRVEVEPNVWEPPYPEAPLVLCVAESLAYNDANLAMVAGEDAGPVVYEQSVKNVPFPRVRDYITFFRSHIHDLIDTTPVADVAILRSFASIEFNPAKSNVSTMLFEQTLIQCKFPFGIIFDTHLKDLSRHKVVVLANQDALSNEQVEQIRRFVAAGGGLVATEETSLLTEWRRKREKFALADLLGISVPPEEGQPMNPVRREFGKGRVVYIPRIEPAVAPPPAMMSYSFSKLYWKLPKNYEVLAEAVRWAAREELSASVEAPLWVTIELAEQKSTDTWLLHLVNFREEVPLGSISVRVRIPSGKRLQEAILESPDGVPRQALDVSGHEGFVSFTVAKLKVHDLILLRMGKK